MSNEIEQLNEGGTVQFSIREGYFNGYPTSVKVDNELSPINPVFTNLPYRPTGYYGKNKLRTKISSFNGYPMIFEKYNINGILATTNLPLRYVSRTKYMFQIKDDILEGYPSMFALDANFNPDDFIMHVSNDHYVTPLRAKMLIHKYLSEYMRNRGVYKAPLVTDISITPKRERLLLEWKSPVDDPKWSRTVVVISENGFVSVDNETNTVNYPLKWNGKAIAETKDSQFDFPYEVTGLENGKEYYITFMTVSKTGIYNVYDECKVIGVPVISYVPLYGSFGEYIGKEAIPVGED